MTTDNHHDPNAPAQQLFMCGNVILVSEFAKLVTEEERESIQEFQEQAQSGELPALKEQELRN